MPIEFLCPRCTATITVPDDAAGKKGRCPQCQGKLRVPLPPPPPMAEIEFQCPRCSTTIRVAGEAAGKKGRCPKCQGKLLVPTDVAPAVSSVSEPLQTATEPVPPAQPELPELAAVASSGASRTRRRKQSGLAALVIPVLFLSILGGTVAWYYRSTLPKLEGTLVAERLAATELPPVRLDPEFIKMSKRDFRDLLENLSAEPIRIKGKLLRLEIRGRNSEIEFVPEIGTATAFYRVDPKVNKYLSKYAADHSNEFNDPRHAEIASAAPKFLAWLYENRRSKATAEGVLQFRDSVVIASMVRGLGYRVHAFYNGEAHRCVYEDAEGRLYFLLPPDVKSFELLGRDLSVKDKTIPSFPAHYQVTVTAEKVLPEPKSKPTKKKKSPQEATGSEPSETAN